jgi:pyruvyl transferase EpsO
VLREYCGHHVAASFDHLARLRLARGVRILSRGRVVITDRLHGHILGLLMGIPHVILDNNYGKLRAYHSRFTVGADNVLQAASQNEALALAAQLLASTKGHY